MVKILIAIRKRLTLSLKYVANLKLHSYRDSCTERVFIQDCSPEFYEINETAV